MENKKLTQEEIKSLQELREKENQVIYNIGYLEIITKQQKIELENQYIEIQTQLKTIADQLQSKYGEGNINIETGDFVPLNS